MRIRWQTCVLMVVLAGTGSAPAQDDDKPVVKATPAVSVPVLVRDHKGVPVTGLAATNFSVKVDGVAQKLTDAPLGAAQSVTYGLVIDVSSGQRHALEHERTAARVLVAAMKPGDQMFVEQFAKPIELLAGPTDDKAKLGRALDELGTSSPTFKLDEPKGPDVDEEGRKIHTGGDSLNDALFLASDEVMAKAPGRHVVIAMSDGIDVGSKMSINDSLESIERNGVIVYTVYARNEDLSEHQEHNNGAGRNGGGSSRPSSGGGGGWPGSYPGGGGGYPGSYPGGGGSGGNNPNSGGSTPNKPSSTPEHKPNVDGVGALEKLANQTGGRMFDGSKRGSLDEDVVSVADDVHSMYWLTFTPEGAAARHGYHPFDLSVTGSDKSKKVDVQAPDGYYGH